MVEYGRTRQIKRLLYEHQISISIPLEIIGLRKFCLSIAFILWLAFFANQPYKNNRKTQLQ